MVSFDFNRFMRGLASGADSGLGSFAKPYVQTRTQDAYNKGIGQIQQNDWEGGLNTIGEWAPETALALAQAKKKADDTFALEQMKEQAQERARNTITPYQQAMLGIARQRLAQSQNQGVGQTNVTNPLDKKRIETIAKKMDENIETSQTRLDDYNRMEQLLNNPNVETGGIKGAIQEKLPDGMLNTETAELRSIIKKIVPQMRPAGSGTTSDRDMKIFEQATVGLGKDKQANLNIIKGRKIVDENNIAKEELRYEWLSMGGNLGDFDREWRKYLNANPIFENDNGQLNQKRKDPYEWFTSPRQSDENVSQNQNNDVQEGAIIEDANGNRLILRGGQWQQM